MPRRLLAVVLLVVACGSSTSTPTDAGASATGGSGGGMTGGGTGSTGGGTTAGADAGTDAGLALACLGQPLPTSAPAMLTLSGSVLHSTASATKAVADAGITLTQGATVLATSTTTASGQWALSAPTQGLPIDGFFTASGGGFLDTNLYPSAALAAGVGHHGRREGPAHRSRGRLRRQFGGWCADHRDAEWHDEVHRQRKALID